MLYSKPLLIFSLLLYTYRPLFFFFIDVGNFISIILFSTSLLVRWPLIGAAVAFTRVLYLALSSASRVAATMDKPVCFLMLSVHAVGGQPLARRPKTHFVQFHPSRLLLIFSPGAKKCNTGDEAGMKNTLRKIKLLYQEYVYFLL